MKPKTICHRAFDAVLLLVIPAPPIGIANSLIYLAAPGLRCGTRDL